MTEGRDVAVRRLISSPSSKRRPACVLRFMWKSSIPGIDLGRADVRPPRIRLEHTVGQLARLPRFCDTRWPRPHCYMVRQSSANTQLMLRTLRPFSLLRKSKSTSRMLRRSGGLIRSRSTSIELKMAYAAAVAGEGSAKPKPMKDVPRSVGALSRSYYQSDAFRTLGEGS